jgi:ATP-dependent Clp protease ATP-binding subunit ClpA
MMTSNAGTREMSTQSIGFGDNRYDTEDKGKKAVEQFFSPEFRNRLDDIIHFNALNEEIMKKVVDKFMNELKEQLIAKKVSVSLSSDARTWLATKGHDPRYGARYLDRLIQTEIKDILSNEILFGRLDNGGEVFIDFENDKLTFEYVGENVLVS